MFAQRLDLDFSSPFDTDLKRVETTVSVQVRTSFPDAISTVNRLIIRQLFQEAITQ